MKILAEAQIPLLDILFKEFDLEVYTTLTPELLQADVVITRSNVRLDAALLAKSNVKVIASPVSGCDHFDKEGLQQHDIRWLHAPGCNAIAVAEYVLGCLAWIQTTRHQPKRIGIIGVGHIGSLVADYVNALGLEVICYDPPRSQRDASFQSATLHEILSCDVITLHTPLTVSPPSPTHHLVDAAFLRQLKNSVIINTARGNIIDTQALREHGATIDCIADVFSDEPNLDTRFVNKLLLATPHIAGHSVEGKQRGIVDVQQQIYQHFALPAPEPHPVVSKICHLDRSHWAPTVLAHYHPYNDRLQHPSTFTAQRRQYRQRHEHRYVVE
jgi:erythronate-4-phosphate dehydrogenase